MIYSSNISGMDGKRIHVVRSLIITFICIEVDVRDVITQANFGDDRFRAFDGAGIEFSTFPWTSTTVPASDSTVHRVV